jgi:hypothetical protein
MMAMATRGRSESLGRGFSLVFVFVFVFVFGAFAMFRQYIANARPGIPPHPEISLEEELSSP